MPTTTAYASPGTVTTTGGWVADSGTLVTAVASSDDVRATHAAAAADADYLVCTNFGFSIPAGSVVTGIDLYTEDLTAMLLKAGEVPRTGAYYTLNGSTNQGTEKLWTTSQTSLPGLDGSQTVSWTGLSLTPAQVNASTFGVRIHRGSDTTPPDIPPESGRAIDRVQLRVTYTVATPISNPFIPELDQMDIRHLADKGGLKSLGGEALPSLSSAALICTTIPANTRVALISVRTADITIRLDGSTPTAGANGIDIKAGSNPLILPMTKDQLAVIKGIQSGGTATGWIEYLGKP